MCQLWKKCLAKEMKNSFVKEKWSLCKKYEKKFYNVYVCKHTHTYIK